MDGSSGDLRGHLGRLLGGSIPLIAFQRWFIDAEPDIELHGSDEEYELAGRVLNRLAEFSGGHIDEGELKDALREYLEDSAKLRGVVFSVLVQSIDVGLVNGQAHVLVMQYSPRLNASAPPITFMNRTDSSRRGSPSVIPPIISRSHADIFQLSSASC